MGRIPSSPRSTPASVAKATTDKIEVHDSIAMVDAIPTMVTELNEVKLNEARPTVKDANTLKDATRAMMPSAELLPSTCASSFDDTCVIGADTGATAMRADVVRIAPRVCVRGSCLDDASPPRSSLSYPSASGLGSRCQRGATSLVRELCKESRARLAALRPPPPLAPARLRGVARNTCRDSDETADIVGERLAELACLREETHEKLCEIAQ